MNLQPKNISISRPDFLRQWSSAATNSASQNRSSKSNTNHYRTKAAIGSFFRSAGLKLLFRAFSSDKEQKKIVVGASRWLAFARAGVHILPMAMTIMIVGMNWAQLLNGPAMSTLMVFVLQVVAKLHELTIVASLTAIALDIIRYHVINYGISIGLASSGLSIGSLSWIWTIDFLGGFGIPPTQQDIKKEFRKLPARIKTVVSLLKSLNTHLITQKVAQSKLLLLFLLISCTLLATTVGPASALLFIPTEQWISSASTDFYIRGTPDMLWPKVLGQNHTAVQRCGQLNNIDIVSCMDAGWNHLVAAMRSHNPSPLRWSILDQASTEGFLPPTSIISGGFPDDKEETETWATAPHMAVSAFAAYLSSYAQSAFGKAQGRNKRLRDFSNKDLVIVTGGKIPVARTACSNVTEVLDAKPNIPFPILTEKVSWRPGYNYASGPIRQLNAVDLGLASWTALTELKVQREEQVRAKWFPLPEGLGSGSAGLVYLVQNQSMAYARGCIVEAWWAQGQTLRSRPFIGITQFSPWTVMPGFKSHREGNENVNPKWERLFDPAWLPYYENVIKTEQAWIDALTPLKPEATQPGVNLTMTNFEALVNLTAYNRVGEVLYNWETNGPLLEYIISVFFVNALARVGYVYQLKYAQDITLDDSLLAPPIVDDSFISGKNVYSPRDPSEPYVRGRFESYMWGTAWTLANPVQRGAAALLCTYLLLAIFHTSILLILGRSSEAWDSITELLILAYKSTPNPQVFENCGGGVERAETLRKEVKIGVRTLSTGQEQVELFVCEMNDRVGSIVVDQAYS